MARRKTMRMSEIRALTNRMLAGSDPDAVEMRRGVASMYEHLAMAAGDYHGFNDIVQIWSGEPGKSTYVEDTTCRRQYFGAMSGLDAQAAEDAIRAYRASAGDPELDRRHREASNIQLDGVATEIADSITKAARGSGDDPIAWVTGNNYMPPLRSFAAAEQVWQASTDGEDFAYLTELVEAKLSEAGVALECPEYDNALYAVDLRRFEYREDPDGETLQGDWQPIAQPADEPVDWAGRTFGQLTPDKKRRATRQAGEQLSAELTANADAIGQVMDEADHHPAETDDEAAYYRSITNEQLDKAEEAVAQQEYGCCPDCEADNA